MKQKIADAFSKHVNNEFPPQFVFFYDDLKTLHGVALSEVASLHVSYNFLGMTNDSLTYTGMKNAGNLPILKLKDD